VGEEPLKGAGGFEPGSRVGGYLLERQIGHGGMAAVFTARDERLGRVVALKVLAPALAADEAFRQRFIRESRAAAAVDDPHIIPLFEAGQAGDVLFIAMRYVPGGDVRALLFREGPLPAERAAAIISPVASALDAAHAAGLVHRDVKPANMLLDARPGRPDHVYLSDFGLTKEAAGVASLTGTGLFLGTVDYAAPEQIDGRPVDGRADQYALACAAYEMLTGQPPFPRDQAMAVLAAHLSQPPPPASTRRAGLPASLDAVFARALAKSPQDRYGSCGEFSDALREAAGIGRYDAAPPAGHPATQLAWVTPQAGGNAADLGTKDTAISAPSHAGPSAPTFPSAPPQPPWPGAGPGRRPAASWPIAVIAAAVALAAAAAVVFILMAAPGHSPGAATAGRTPAKTVTATPTGSWTSYHDPSGFSISLPAGSAVTTRSPGEVKFAVTPAGFVAVVAWSHHPQPDALADWRQQAAAKAAADPSYQQIRIQRVTYRGYNAADWEFTNIYQGVLTHVIDRTFIVQPGHLAYALELYGPDAQWPAVYPSLWQRLLASFEPGR